MATIINGKAVAAKVLAEVAAQVREIRAQGVVPSFAAIIVGNDPASALYVKKKQEACAQVGIESTLYKLPEETAQAELLALIDRLNRDASVHAILCQMPVPKHIDDMAVIRAVDTNKDVDAFSALIDSDLTDMAPCTPAGIVELLKTYGIDIRGKECVIVGRGKMVGRPLALQLMLRDGTVTVCHTKTRDLKFHTARADILVAAVGRPEMIPGAWVKPGAVVIDVGINRIERDGKTRLVGDVDFASAAQVAGAITPVPGGVGPMTIACLLANTLTAACRANGLPEPEGLTA